MEMNNYNPEDLTRTIWTLFWKEFAIQSNDKLIINFLANHAMNTSKTTWDLLNRLAKMMVIIKESYTHIGTSQSDPKMTSMEACQTTL
jgi:hypothetical protein